MPWTISITEIGLKSFEMIIDMISKLTSIIYDNLKDLEDEICEFVKTRLTAEIIRSVYNAKYVALWMNFGIG